MRTYAAPIADAYELEQTVDLIEEATLAAADALANAAGALVQMNDPQRDRLASALEDSARHLYTAATLAGQLEAAGAPSPNGGLYRTLRKTVEGLGSQVETASTVDLRGVILTSLRLLETTLEPRPEEIAAQTQSFIREIAANRAPTPANDNRAPEERGELKRR